MVTRKEIAACYEISQQTLYNKIRNDEYFLKKTDKGRLTSYDLAEIRRILGTPIKNFPIS